MNVTAVVVSYVVVVIVDDIVLTRRDIINIIWLLPFLLNLSGKVLQLIWDRVIDLVKNPLFFLWWWLQKRAEISSYGEGRGGEGEGRGGEERGGEEEGEGRRGEGRRGEGRRGEGRGSRGRKGIKPTHLGWYRYISVHLGTCSWRAVAIELDGK